MPNKRLPAEKRKPTKYSKRTLIKARRQIILKLHTEGKTNIQIAEAVAINPALVQREIDLATEEFLRSWAEQGPEHTFVRYASFQLNIVRKLQAAHDRFLKDKHNKQYNAAISALRAQSDIYDKVLDKGITFGVIEQTKAKDHIRQSSGEIRIRLQKEVRVLSRLLEEVDNPPGPPPKQLTLPPSTGTDDLQSASTLYPIIVNPLMGPLGVIRDSPDWRLRKLSPARKDKSPPPVPTSEEEKLAAQATYLQAELDRISYLQEEATSHRKDTNIIDIDPQDVNTITNSPPPGNNKPNPASKDKSKQPNHQQDTQAGWLVKPMRG